MGKDSEYYKNKKKDQIIKYRELLKLLPGFAVDYLHSKELGTQTSTLVSYAYDLLTFFRFLRANNSVFSKYEIKDIPLELLANLVATDIEEYQRYLELNEDGEKHENGKRAIARKMSPLRGIFQFLNERELIDKNPMTLVKLPKLKKDKNLSLIHI